MRRSIIWGVLWCFFCAPILATEKPIRLVFPIFKPFTYMHEGVPAGEGIEAILAITAALGQSLTLLETPNYGRAVHEARLGHVDGFLLASKNAERDAFAVFSQPVTYNNWMWFFSKSSTWEVTSPQFRTHAKVGTYLHANTHKWLIKNEFQNIYASPRTAYLPSLLVAGKLDAALLAEKVFWEQAKEQQVDRSAFQAVLAIEKPFGIYISKQYLEENTGYMERLNRAIQAYRKKHAARQ